MSGEIISAELKDFVFQYIDSVEQLEILLLLASDAKKPWTADAISQHLRSNRNSVEKRLHLLLSESLIEALSEKGHEFQFCFRDPDCVKIVSELAQVYKVHRYKILEMIFSPIKKGRDFADAFDLSGRKDPKGGRHG